MTAKTTPFHHWGNPEYAKGMAELRRSGAAGTHKDKRTRRARTRAAARTRALTDWSN